MVAVTTRFNNQNEDELMKSQIVSSVRKKAFQNSPSEALIEMVFDDLVILLKFIHKAQNEGLLKGSFVFTNQIDYLDSIWHHFILHTRIYHEFCEQEFGEFLHHEPDSNESSEMDDKINSSLDLTNLIAKQMSLMEKFLGNDFVNRIFFIYPELLK